MPPGHVPPRQPLPSPFSESSCAAECSDFSRKRQPKVARIFALWGLGQGRGKFWQGIWNQAQAEGGVRGLRV